MVDGQNYRVTLDHKPTKNEALALISSKIGEKRTDLPDMTFEEACRNYIGAKSNVLSPSTIRRYFQYLNNMPEKFKAVPIYKLTRPLVQAEVNRFSCDHAPKTTISYSGFIVSILNFYGSDIGKITLPQKEKKSPYIPTEAEVHAIFAEVKGTMFEIPILLAAMGLRRSEICALTPEDLNGNVLTIDKALVENEKKEWVVKTTKTTDSTRTIVLPDYLVQLINEKGEVYHGFPGSIHTHLSNVQTKLGIQHFSLHKLRHFFASYMHSLGYSDKQIQEMGGWHTDHVMKSVYQHAMEMDEAKKSAAVSIGKLI